jgi:hypothetical protein
MFLCPLWAERSVSVAEVPGEDPSRIAIAPGGGRDAARRIPPIPPAGHQAVSPLSYVPK